MSLVGISPQYNLRRPSPRPWGTLTATVPPSITDADRPCGGISIQSGSFCGDALVVCADCEINGRGSDRTDGVTVFGDVHEFHPFLVYTDAECGILSGIDLAEIASWHLGIAAGKQIAEQLYADTAECGSPAIIKNPTIIATTDDEGLIACQAIARLEQEIAANHPNLQAYFHVTVQMLQILAAEDCIEREEDDMTGASVFYTRTGNIVIGDAGYDGRVPLDENGDPIEPALGVDEEFIYVTGPLAWGVSQETVRTGDKTTDISGRYNQMTAMADRLAIVAFDPDCMHYAIRAKAQP